MAGVKARGLDGIWGMVTLWDEKVNRRAYTRRKGHWAMRWVIFLLWWAIRKLGRGRNDLLFTGPRQFERVMVKLLAGSRWQDVRWHAWRRLCAATLFHTGAPMPNNWEVSLVLPTSKGQKTILSSTGLAQDCHHIWFARQPGAETVSPVDLQADGTCHW